MDPDPGLGYQSSDTFIKIEIEPENHHHETEQNETGSTEQSYMKIDTSILQVQVKIEEGIGEYNANPHAVFDIPNDFYNTNPDTSGELSQINGITEKVYQNGRINRVCCPQCGKSFKNRANLKNHLKYVHASEESIVECGQCYRQFKSKAHLRTHINSVHAEVKVVTCQYCEKTFLNKRKLDNHILYAHPQPGDEVSCEICQKTYKSSVNLRIHKRQVHPSEDVAVTCQICGKLFKNDMLLQRHVKWSHPSDGMVYRCPLCNRTLPSLLCYQNHLKNVHSDTSTSCKICFKIFKTPKNLERHEKIVHMGQKPEPRAYKVGDFKCTECDKMFVTLTALDWHFLRSHTENKTPHICNICSKELSDKGGLKRHLEMCHSNHFVKCVICDKDFKSYPNLERHIKVTHASPDEVKTCEICQKQFKCMMHLRIHINAVHSKDGSFTCDICNKEFSSKKYMTKHRKTHVATKDHPCDVCHKYFKSIGDVNKHKKRVHIEDTIKQEPIEINMVVGLGVTPTR